MANIVIKDINEDLNRDLLLDLADDDLDMVYGGKGKFWKWLGNFAEKLAISIITDIVLEKI
ncbi:hypothetical protein [Moorena producens]|uniref:hypothetical protein n=1 Tax=Moorena producens TaxID=1155739 RepID=UPI003C74D42F